MEYQEPDLPAELVKEIEAKTFTLNEIAPSSIDYRVKLLAYEDVLAILRRVVGEKQAVIAAGEKLLGDADDLIAVLEQREKVLREAAQQVAIYGEHASDCNHPRTCECGLLALQQALAAGAETEEE